jgi:hypothetical protein
MLVVTGYPSEPPVAAVATFAKPFDTGALLDEVERQHAASAGARA